MLLVAVATLTLAVAEAVPAFGQVSTSVRIVHELKPDGTGQLFASPVPYGKGSISWASCPPGSGCAPIASSPQGDHLLDVGYATPGTAFVATTIQGSRELSATSARYLGPVGSTAPPRLSGELRAGALVRPLPGHWSGGWGKEVSYTQIQVCRTPDGSDCVVVADGIYWDRCPDAGAMLLPSYRGRDLRVVDRRVPSERPILTFAVLSPVALRPARSTPTAAVTVVGPVGPATGPAESNCGRPPPLIDLASRPRRVFGRLRLGHVSCLMRCEVVVTVRQERRRLRRMRRLPGRLAQQTLWLSRSAARQLTRVTAFFTVRIIGARHRITDARIKVPPR